MPPRRDVVPARTQADALAQVLTRLHALEALVSGLLPASGEWELVQLPDGLHVKNRRTGTIGPLIGPV